MFAKYLYKFFLIIIYIYLNRLSRINNNADIFIFLVKKYSARKLNIQLKLQNSSGFVALVFY